MYFTINRLKFFGLLVIASAWSFQLFAVNCSVSNTPITLDDKFNSGIESLISAVSEPVANRKGLRQTLDTPQQTKIPKCTQVSIVSNSGNTLKVVLSNQHLFLQGFITLNNIFYHFSNASIRTVKGTTAKNLGFSNNYNNLAVSSIRLSYVNINRAVDNLAGFNGKAITRIRQDVARVMFITSESVRFRSINDISSRILTHNPQSIRWNDYSPSIRNWRTLSSLALAEGVVIPLNVATALGTKNDVQIALRRP
ncbi:MAG: ribosome-inactivating family protein [Alphaproteobacteria bacterium]|nr:ribosome-inactivating family protein [Alphaproteobacteria bacterium]